MFCPKFTPQRSIDNLYQDHVQLTKLKMKCRLGHGCGSILKCMIICSIYFALHIESARLNFLSICLASWHISQFVPAVF